MSKKKIKITEIIKKYPIIVGCVLIIIVMGLVLEIKLDERKSAIEATVVTQDMGRGATIDGFATGKDTVRYLISALREGDLDKALRAFPIDETILRSNTAKIIDIEKQFSSEFCPPSATYAQYVPAASSEIAGQYAEEISSLLAETNWGDTELIDVRILLPEQQLTGQYQRKMLELSECQGADVMCEMVAGVTDGKNLYMLPLTVAKYGESWKVFRMEAVISESVENGLIEADKKTYESL